MKSKDRAKGMEAEAKEIGKNFKEIMLPILAAYEVKSCAIDGLGKIAFKTNKGSSVNEKKLREALLIEGLKSPIVNRIIKKSSTTWSTEYVDFVRAPR